MVLEENGGLHSVQRALGHARRSNRLQCLGDFIRADTPANGLQVLGRNDNRWDQGQLFISQDTTYLAPCGVAQTMLADAAGSTAVAGRLVDTNIRSFNHPPTHSPHSRADSLTDSLAHPPTHPPTQSRPTRVGATRWTSLPTAALAPHRRMPATRPSRL